MAVGVMLLKRVMDLLPSLADRLAPWDFRGLCRRLAALAGEAGGGAGVYQIQEGVGDIVKRLDAGVPGIAVQLRGQARGAGVEEGALNGGEARRLAEECGERARWALATHEVEEDAKRGLVLALAELWILDRLPGPMKQQAVRVRDWCEERLEFIHSRGAMRYYTAHGIGHSKRVLRHAVAFLRGRGGNLASPPACLLTYAAAYAHDLGLMFRPGEDPDDEHTFECVRSTHGQRALETIVGNLELGLPPAWQAMGLQSEREAMLVGHACAVHQRRFGALLAQLPIIVPLFAGGRLSNIPLRALAGIVRLSDALDCHEKRLPPSGYLRDRHAPVGSLLEYIRHEVVEDVQVDSDWVIHVAMRSRYKYPVGFDALARARAALGIEISEVSSILGDCGFPCPPAEFTCFETLFPEPHPYLRGEGVEGVC